MTATAPTVRGSAPTRSLYSDEEERYRAAFRSFVADDPPPEMLHNDRDEVRRLLAWHGRLGRAGLACLHWPREHGGAGLPLGAQLVQQEELARLGVPHRPLMVGLSMAGPLLIAHGSALQQLRHLSAIREGREQWTQLFSEPDAGSDLLALRTRAERDGDEVVLHGEKVWSSYAHMAEWGLLLARSTAPAPGRSPSSGLVVVIVPMGAAGVEVTELVQLTGDAEFCQVRLDGVRVPLDNVVGEWDRGWAAAVTVLNSERTAIGLSYYAKLTVELEALRRDPGASSRRWRQRLAALHASVTAQRLTAIRVASGIERGLDFGPLASLGKLHATRNWQELADLRLDILGPHALTGEDVASERAVREFLDTRSLSIGGGTTEIQKNAVAERVLGLPR